MGRSRNELLAFAVLCTTVAASCGGPTAPQAHRQTSVAQPVEPPPSFHRDNDSCAACHESVYASWESSQHALAWTSETFRIASDNYEKQECLSCHAPELVLRSGLGAEPILRDEERAGGVTCVACHQDALADDWKMHGPYEVDSPGHETVTNPAFHTADVCESCHGHAEPFDQFHSWQAGPYGQSDFSCQNCHMPATEELLAADYPEYPLRWVGDHSFPGAHSDEVVGAATRLSAETEGDQIVIGVENQAGHLFPGGAYRAATLSVTIDDATTEVVRISYEDGNRIPSGETREVRFTLPQGVKPGSARVTLRFQRAEPSEDGLSIVVPPGGAVISETSVTF